MEYWWNIPIKTATKIPHNKPDLVIWNDENFVENCRRFQLPIRLENYKESCREGKQVRTTHS